MNLLKLLEIWFLEKRLSASVAKMDRLLQRNISAGLGNEEWHRAALHSQQLCKMMLSQTRRVLIDYGWRKEI